MKRSLLGVLASLVLGITAVVTNPAPVPAGAAGMDVAQVQPADHDGCCDKDKGKGDKDKGEKKGDDGDDKDCCRHKGGDDDGDKKDDKGDRDRHRHGDGDGRRCVGLIVICIG
jgi:hypothetical protein